MLRVADLLASSQSSSRIIWKHYGSVWRTNKTLDIKCLVLTVYWKAVAVFWRNGCAVISAALFCLCMCVSWFPGAISSLQKNMRCYFALLPSCFEAHWDRLKRRWSVKLFFVRLHPVLSTTWTANAPSLTQPCLHKVLYQLNTAAVFAQWGDGQALSTSATAEWSPNMTCFLPSSPLLLSFSLTVCLCLFWKKETHVPIHGETH